MGVFDHHATPAEQEAQYRTRRLQHEANENYRAAKKATLAASIDCMATEDLSRLKAMHEEIGRIPTRYDNVSCRDYLVDLCMIIQAIVAMRIKQVEAQTK